MEKLTKNLWFRQATADDYSQNGEDGIIAKIFSLIATENQFLIECGAADGVKNSNARKLITKDGWQGLLIEPDLTQFERLQNNYLDYQSVVCVNRFISFEGADTLDAIFAEYHVPPDVDLFVLDIDGNEYHVWAALEQYRPRVMVVEFNPTIPNGITFVQPRDMSVQQGSSLDALVELAHKKQYQLVALTDFNAFFVRDEDAKPFLHLDRSVATLRPNNRYETKLFQLYDGTLKIAGYDQLHWHKLPIDEKKLQVLPRSRRIYLNGLSHSDWVRRLKHVVRQSPMYPLVRTLRQVPLIRRVLK